MLTPAPPRNCLPSCSPPAPRINRGSFHLRTGKLSDQQRWKLRLDWMLSLVFIYLFSPAGEKIIGLGKTEACTWKLWGKKQWAGGQRCWFMVQVGCFFDVERWTCHLSLYNWGPWSAKGEGATIPTSCLLAGLWIRGSFLYPTHLPVAILQDLGSVLPSLYVSPQWSHPFS